MKSINELKQERAQKIAQMSGLVDRVMAENRAKTESESQLWNDLDKEVTTLDETIRMAERQEDLNKKLGIAAEIKTQPKHQAVAFRDWLKESVHQGKTSSMEVELRADPLITSTDTGIINKNIANGIDILTSPAEAFLRQLGVIIYSGLNGNFIVPSMAEDTATFANESGDASTADMSTSSLTLAARRVTHTQSISKETLAQTNPAIYASILQNLVNGVWNAVTYDVFDTLQSDAAASVTTPTVAGLTFGDLVKMEASIGGLNIGQGAYVTTPTGKAYMKQKIALGTTVGPAIWQSDNTINGYPAYGVPAANANAVYFGDFSRMNVGQWGNSIELVVDPYTKAKQGQIVLTVIGMFDSGCSNRRGVCWTANASMGL